MTTFLHFISYIETAMLNYITNLAQTHTYLLNLCMASGGILSNTEHKIMKVLLLGAMSRWYHVFLIWGNEDNSPLWYSSPKLIIPASSWENIRQIQIGIYFTKHLTHFKKIVRVMKNKETLINCCRLEQDKEAWQQNAMLCLELDPGIEKGH